MKFLTFSAFLNLKHLGVDTGLIVIDKVSEAASTSQALFQTFTAWCRMFDPNTEDWAPSNSLYMNLAYISSLGQEYLASIIIQEDIKDNF